MLSTISSHPAPPTFSSSPALQSTMAASLPIMPSRPSQRPKLTVNTHQPRIFGKGASLRLDTLSAVSPTVRNTFNNAYEPTTTTNTSNTLNTFVAPPPGPPAKLRLEIGSTTSNPASICTPDSASTLSSSTLTSASSESASSTIPYKQPHNLNSILANSRIVPRKMASRPMFPAEKRVSFRTPLEEEIKTVKYTWANSDLESSSSTLTSLESTSTDSTSTESEATATHHSVTPKLQLSKPSLSLQSFSEKPTIAKIESSPRQRKPPRLGDKRDSSESEDDSDTCPQTPVAGRRKRSRDWRWTLGKLPGDNVSTASTGSDDDSS
ncbi:hypothetical protein BU25DRAFT_348684 [Macroventuria anomochaeta]|uniref:Uncharacterized protein n=1 Tax=Macroventuria anomochaeta TaxID=301207 RepID=A0ACB6RR45_9PLEO|nr:uncharacterized protein BU25DRAFT_348684 [Macroventuria anomochaeta]KAF2624208.1 hypothetical protein BU25DRAFT_348684 [Macroventuria anomochaeta]